MCSCVFTRRKTAALVALAGGESSRIGCRGTTPLIYIMPELLSRSLSAHPLPRRQTEVGAHTAVDTPLSTQAESNLHLDTADSQVFECCWGAVDDAMMLCVSSVISFMFQFYHKDQIPGDKDAFRTPNLDFFFLMEDFYSIRKTDTALLLVTVGCVCVCVCVCVSIYIYIDIYIYISLYIYVHVCMFV